MVCLKTKSVFAVFSSVLLCAGLLFGCGEKAFDAVLTLDGEKITPAVYRMYQIQSYFEASQQVSSLADTIDGINVIEWINRNTLELLRQRRYYNQQFAQQGLSFTEAEQQELDRKSETSWQSAGAVYLRNGVDKDTFLAYQLDTARQNALFGQYCADLSDEEIRQYLEDEFVLIEYTQLPCFDSSGKAMEEETLQQVQSLARSALREVRKGGKTFAAACAGAVSGAYALGGFSAPDLENTDSYLFSTYLSRTAGGESEKKLTAAILETAIGDCGSYEDGQFILLFHRLPNWETEEDFEALRPSVLWQMRGDAFRAEGAAVWDQYELETDEEAIDWYTPQKLDLSSPTEEEEAAIRSSASSGSSSGQKAP